MRRNLVLAAAFHVCALVGRQPDGGLKRKNPSAIPALSVRSSQKRADFWLNKAKTAGILSYSEDF